MWAPVAVLVLLVPVVSATASAEVATADSVKVSLAFLDSVAVELETLEVERSNLEIDLRTALTIATVDSMANAEKLRIYADALNDARRGWLERYLSHPSLWLAIGVYLGVKAGE